MTKVTAKVIQWNCTEYIEGISLRNEFLNKTANLPLLKKAPINEKNFIHIAAFLDDKVVGTLFILPVYESTIQIKQVAVSDKYQGMGIEKKLILFVEEQVKESGGARIILDGRDSAWVFYESLGYSEKGLPKKHGDVYLKQFEKQVTQPAVLHYMYTA